MRQLTLLICCAVLLLSACSGNKTGANASGSDSTEVPDSLNSVEAVIRQVNAVYAYQESIRQYYMTTPPNQLEENKFKSIDELFGTREWLETSKAVEALDRECECGGFYDFGEEGPLSPWFYNCFEGEVRADSIEAKQLGDGTAQVDFLVRDAMTIKGVPIRWLMRVEGGQWRVADIIFVRDDNYDLLQGMKAYIEQGGTQGEALLNLKDLPATARRVDAFFQYAVYINLDLPASAEGEMDQVCSVWLADERVETMRKVCKTNPMAKAQWEKMNKGDSNAVEVTMDQIAAADTAWVCPKDVNKVIVQGCPDGRNIWTYIIDVDNQRAWQLPSTEGVVGFNWDQGEIFVASYGYDDDGRYSYQRAYSIEGKYIRHVGEKERE